MITSQVSDSEEDLSCIEEKLLFQEREADEDSRKSRKEDKIKERSLQT
jgi:hypothetical protein